VAKAIVEGLGDAALSDNGFLAALAAKTGALTQRLAQWLPEGLPAGVPAGALPLTFTSALPREGIVGDSAGPALRAGFKDVLARNGMAAALGAASGEGFLWGVAGAEPRLQAQAAAAAAASLAAAQAAQAAAAGTA
jgi:hypothetical protein